MSEPLDVPQGLSMELYAGLKVVQEKQSEINRRIGNIERSLEVRAGESGRLAALEDAVETLEAVIDEQADDKKDWWTWGWQAVGLIIINSALVWVGLKLGVPLNGN